MNKEKILNLAYSLGAAVVIFGAWCKLEHKSFADTMLTIGLFTEVAIFIIYGFDGLRGKPSANKPLEKQNVNKWESEESVRLLSRISSTLDKAYR
jgi:gliding motility-associated protein GldL